MIVAYYTDWSEAQLVAAELSGYAVTIASSGTTLYAVFAS